MAGISSALYLGQAGMIASQKAMEVLGNNVANANTEGYSRQDIELESLPTVRKAGLSFGQGVQVSGIERAQDEFIVDRLRNTGGQLGEAEGKASSLADLERIVNLDESGLADKIDSFFAAWEELALNPGEEVERDAVLQQADSLAAAFSGIEDNVQGVRGSINNSLESLVQEVNVKLGQVAELNAKIERSQSSQGGSNTALDQRDQLLQDLAQDIGAQAVAGDNDAVSVILPSGLTLVQDANAFTLQPQDGDASQYTLDLGGSEMDLGLSDVGGKLYGLMQVRDQVVADIEQGLGNLRHDLIAKVNSQHSQGVGLDGSTGLDFFEPVGCWQSDQDLGDKDSVVNTSGSDQTLTIDGHDFDLEDGTTTLEGLSSTINSADIGVLASVIKDQTGFELRLTPEDAGDSVSVNSDTELGTFAESSGLGDSLLQVAISDGQSIAAGLSTAPGDNRNAQAIVELKNETAINGSYTFIDYYGKLASELGLEVQDNEFSRTSLQDTMDQLENRRDEVSGVSIDESMIDLQRYQQSFQASARFLTVVDEMMQTLLNIKR